MTTIRVEVKKSHPDARTPRFMHTGGHGDLAADLYAVEETKIEPHKMNVVRTGICLGLPEGYGALVHDRSGLAAKGVATFGGVIDPGYRGELKIIMTSVGEQTIEIKPGDRVCQLRFVRLLQAEFVECEELDETVRGAKGFGSTGVSA